MSEKREIREKRDSGERRIEKSEKHSKERGGYREECIVFQEPTQDPDDTDTDTEPNRTERLPDPPLFTE